MDAWPQIAVAVLGLLATAQLGELYRLGPIRVDGGGHAGPGVEYPSPKAGHFGSESNLLFGAPGCRGDWDGARSVAGGRDDGVVAMTDGVASVIGVLLLVYRHVGWWF